MSFIVVVALLAGLLFLLPFLTKRRYGTLGLALAAGAILSDLWVGDLTPIVASTGIILVSPPLESVIRVVLVLLPAIVLLFSSPTQHIFPLRLVGSLSFALLATTLMLETLGSALVVDAVGRPVYDFLVQNKTLIVTICLIAAIIDLLQIKLPKASKGSKAH